MNSRKTTSSSKRTVTTNTDSVTFDSTSTPLKSLSQCSKTYTLSLYTAIEQITKDHEDPEMNDNGSMWRAPHTDYEVFHVANIKLHHLVLETFINVGTEVEVAWGDQQGRIG